MEKIKLKFRPNIAIFCIIVFLFYGCITVHLISDYDEITDQKITELQENYSKYFVKIGRVIGTDEANYTNFIPFYDNVNADINVIKVRALAFNKNKIFLKQIIYLDSTATDLATYHKKFGFSDTAIFTPSKNALNSAFSAMIKFQIGLKRKK